MNLRSYCSNLVRNAQTNFYYAFLFLPKLKREAIFATYAFSRYTDDLVDKADSAESAIYNLQFWRNELHSCYGGHPTHPIILNLQKTLTHFSIPKAYFLILIDGVEMDLKKKRYETFEELYTYCYRVASSIGLICIEIFGYKNPSTQNYAINLGIALQLTNILRDLKEDKKKGHIYLPIEDLDRFGYTESDLDNSIYNPAFVNLMTFQCNRARDYYTRSSKYLAKEDKLTLFSAEIMSQTYFRLLERIEKRKYNIFDKTIRLRNSKRLGVAIQIWLKSLLKGRSIS